MPLLEVERLSKGFGGVRAVHDVSFTLDEGELLGVMGPNGSGKTTLFNLIAGALRPDAGRIRFQGHDVTGLAPHRICARECASTVGATADALRLLALVGLEGRAGQPASALTLMDRKRLELARALATSPRLLLLDEFMAGLNPAETGEAMTLIRELQAGGITVLMVEHIVWALMDLSHRIIVLSAGEKIADDLPAAVAGDPAVVDVYLGTDGGSHSSA